MYAYAYTHHVRPRNRKDIHTSDCAARPHIQLRKGATLATSTIINYDTVVLCTKAMKMLVKRRNLQNKVNPRDLPLNRETWSLRRWPINRVKNIKGLEQIYREKEESQEATCSGFQVKTYTHPVGGDNNIDNRDTSLYDEKGNSVIKFVISLLERPRSFCKDVLQRRYPSPCLF